MMLISVVSYFEMKLHGFCSLRNFRFVTPVMVTVGVMVAALITIVVGVAVALVLVFLLDKTKSVT